MTNTSGGWILNPVKMLAWLYFFANASSFIVLASGGAVGVDLILMSFEPSVVFCTGAALFLSLLFLLSIYKLCDRFFTRKNKLFFSDRWGWALITLQCLFFVNNIYYGVNIAGVEDSSDSGLFKIFFNILQPDLIFLVVAVGLVSEKLFWINLIIFASSMLSRGWVGGFSVVAIVFLCRNYPLRINSKFLFGICALLVTSLALFPFVVELKWVIRSDAPFDDVLSNVFEQGYFVSLGNSVEYLLNRFQMFGHVALMAENANEVADAYDDDQFIPYWADGIFQWLILKVNGIEIFQLNRYMVNRFFGSDNLAYSTNPGLAGWIFILKEHAFILVAYVLALMVIPSRWVLNNAGDKYFLLIFAFVLIYLFHGWVGAYFNFVVYLISILFLNKFLSRKQF